MLSAVLGVSYLMKVCSCGEKETPEKPFYDKSSVCRGCYNTKRAPKQKEYRSKPEVKEHYNDADRKRRVDPLKRSSIILKDSRRSDRRSNRYHNLTLDHIESLINQRCSYCGELDLKMTLDRKDNAIGHTIDNVVPSCVRCNYIRRDMPYEAWLVVAHAIREARELGLFGAWTCEVHKRNLESKAG